MTSSLRAFCSLSLLCYFILTFSQLRVFLDFVNEDALDFAIVPNVSDSVLGLRNRIYSAEPPLAPVFLLPPTLPSSLPYQVLSLALVPSSSSFLLSESDESDDDDSPLCLDEASSSGFFHPRAWCLRGRLPGRNQDLPRIHRWGSCLLLRLEGCWHLLLFPQLPRPCYSRDFRRVCQSSLRYLSSASRYPNLHHLPLLIRRSRRFRGCIVETLRTWTKPLPPFLFFVLLS